MREPAIGCLAVGKQADLILIDLNHLAFTPLNDVRNQLVYCGTGNAVTMTMVLGASARIVSMIRPISASISITESE